MLVDLHGWESAWYALEWLIRIGALCVVPLRRSPQASAGWLMAIFFLPVPGVVAFWMIGSPHFPAWRCERFEGLRPYFDRVAGLLARHPPDDPGAIDALAQRLGYLPAVCGNTVELIDDYDGVIDRLVADVDAARSCVMMTVYIFADDAVGHKVADALGRAVARGVEARVLFDPVGSHHWRRGTLAMLNAAGVDVREALPFRFRLRTRRDMRNHRKLFVIDGQVGYAGSQNIVAKDFRPGVVNRELVARVTGPVVAQIEAAVRADWYLETEVAPTGPTAVPARTGDACLQLLPSGAEYPLEGFETLLVWQIHQARSRVVLATPYFIPDTDVIGAMRTAVARGVEVHLVVSAVVDQRVVHFAQCSYYSQLLEAGVHIHEFRDHLLHAKNVSVDSRVAIVGSSNV
ncbi:MAG: phospholipase D-like domain-containing protein, partial [Janthinobacterium lividum]